MRSDARLGLAPVEGSVGAEILPGGFQEPVRFDALGFRIPLSPTGPPGPASLLALGDSFTFGTGCRADETYPWRVGIALGLRPLNAGFPPRSRM